jgi:ribonucleoside-diphosphate reductase alpha chain
METLKTTSTPFASQPLSQENILNNLGNTFYIKRRDGTVLPFNIQRIREAIAWASRGREQQIAFDLIEFEALKNMYDGITKPDIEQALILAATAFIERDPAYDFVASQLLLRKLFKEVTGNSITHPSAQMLYRQSFITAITKGAEQGVVDKRLLTFDLEKLSYHMVLERDRLFEFMGLKTLHERYFIHCSDRRAELPQAFWMRVAMGLALEEQAKNERAIEFYDMMSQLNYVPSTPTLLHAGLTHPQLSSCFLTTIEDDLLHIFKCLGDNAQLSKWSGGVANDWTNLRATGSMIKSIKTEAQGVVPFLKIANDVTAAINRSGSRRGATCVYLETWHLDIEDFLDLRRNTGDERRRTHDVNTANWIPDLFMKRVINNENWTLFSPDETPELHHTFGKKFEQLYEAYEAKAQQGDIKKFKIMPAQQLWKKMLSRLFETGHPWLTFKDACNVRSPQDHAGVIHSSNLCTEITLNTSAEETAVCNLGSINLEKHIIDGKVDHESLSKTVTAAVRMLDNVIDINFYPTIEARQANLRHRPIGLGLMGFQDALFKLDICFDSPEALKFADEIMETISYNAILASSKLAAERGAYKSYKGSKWDRNIFPQDTIDLLEAERGMAIECPRGEQLDWSPVREHVQKHGMRNSNSMAIAPTATISNISGCLPCIEPIYKNIYVKANMSGEFTIVNRYLVEDLKKFGLWDLEMLDQIKYFDGNLQRIARIPQHIKDKYKEAFEIDPEWLIKISAARGRWIDQSQSHNVFMKGVSGKKLNDIYLAAWRSGLKTTYYLRTLGASQIEKSTLDAKKFGYTQKREYENTESIPATAAAPTEPEFTEEELLLQQTSCSIENGPNCEVCQ